MQAHAIMKNCEHPPRKVRRVTDAIRGRRVNEALAILRFLPNTPAQDVYTTLASAAANAEYQANERNDTSFDPNELWVVNAIADEGMKIKRFRARSHGRTSRIMRRNTHVTVIITDDPTDIGQRARRSAQRRPGHVG
jgi:large subunit ribosomal protein L22